MRVDIRWLYPIVLGVLISLGTCTYSQLTDQGKKIAIIETKIDRMAWDIGELRKQ